MQVPSTHAGRPFRILSIRGVHDDGTLAAIAVLGDPDEEISSSAPFVFIQPAGSNPLKSSMPMGSTRKQGSLSSETGRLKFE